MVSCKKENNSPTHCNADSCRITKALLPWNIMQLLRGNCRIFIPPSSGLFMKTPTEYFAAAGNLSDLCSGRKIILSFWFNFLSLRNVNGLRNLISFLSVQNLKKDQDCCFWLLQTKGFTKKVTADCFWFTLDQCWLLSFHCTSLCNRKTTVRTVTCLLQMYVRY